MPALLLFILLSAMTGTLSGQAYHPPEAATIYYPISADEARAYLTHPFKHDPREIIADRSPLAEATSAEELEDGHYLFVKLEGETAYFNYLMVSDYLVSVGSHNRKLAVRVQDQNGDDLEQAEVLADSEVAKFSPSARAYLRRDWRVELLEIRVNGDTLFYAVEETIRRSKFSHDLDQFGRSVPGYVLLSPYRWARNGVRYFGRGIGRGDWRIYRYPFQRTIRGLFGPDEYTGYLTSSQPQYRPGDTLRFSAWITTTKGKPNRKPLRISFDQGQHGGDTTMTVMPEPAGRYTGEIVLSADEWQLDKSITISLSPLKGKDRIRPRLRVDYSDYKLEEYRLTVDGPTMFAAHEPVVFMAGARDVNGQAIPGGSLKIYLINRQILQTDQALLAVPDILWSTSLPTDRTEQLLSLPDSVFPESTILQVELVTRLHTPSGAADRVQTTFGVVRRSQETPLIQLVGDYLQFTTIGGMPAAATLKVLSPLLVDRELEIELPTTLAFDPRISEYLLITEAGRYRWSTQQKIDAPTIVADWTYDGLYLRAANPQALPLRWQLQDVSGRVIEQGKMIELDSIPTTLLKDNKYSLHYTYLLGGSVIDQETDVIFLDQALTVSVEVPEQVEPGATSRVAIRVRDAEGKAAPGVALSAGTYNARFTKAPYTRLDVDFRSKRPKTLQKYSLATANSRRQFPPGSTLLSDFGLDTAAFYRLRHPAPRYEEHRPIKMAGSDSTRQGQLAPFVVQRGRVQPIRLIYLNQTLVYFDAAYLGNPYTVVADSGKYSLRLVTNDFTYLVPNVRILPGHQLVLSIDGDNWSAKQAREDHLFTTTEGRQILQATLFVEPAVRNDWSEVAAPQGPVFFRHYRQLDFPHAAGCFPFADRFAFQSAVSDSVQLAFEPGYVYRVGPRRERLRPITEEERKRFLYPSSRFTARGIPESARFGLSDRLRSRSKLVFSRNVPLPETEPMTQVTFIERPPALRAIILLGTADTLVLDPTVHRKQQLVGGDYELWLLYDQDSIARRPLQLLNDHQYMISLSQFFPAKARLEPTQDRFWEDADYSQKRTERLLKKRLSPNGASTIAGVVIDGTTDPVEGLAFASVALLDAGGTILAGTNTDLDGHFTLPDLPRAALLEVSYTGYASQRIDLSRQRRGQIVAVLSTGVQLSEVIVTGYSSRHDEYPRGRAVSSREIRSLPTRSINALASRTAGVVVQDATTTSSINIRGSRAQPGEFFVDGTQIDDGLTPGDETVLGGVERPNIRSSFTDLAAFVPHLFTDEQGLAYFDLTFPDDITAWNTFALGQDRRMRKGIGLRQTRSFLPLQAQLYLPRFLVEGDVATARTLVVNRSGEPSRIRLEFGERSGMTSSKDTLVDQLLKEVYALRSPARGQDSLHYTFSLQRLAPGPATTTNDKTNDSARSDVSAGGIANSPSTASFSDGEARSLPVYRRGTQMNAGTLRSLLPGAGSSFLPTDLLDDDHGPVQVSIYGNRLQALGEDLERIIDYPYDCHEQAASRLIGLLARYCLLEAGDEPPKQQDRRLLQSTLNRLAKGQLTDGGYGWWPGSKQAEWWISLHVFQALHLARQRAAKLDLRIKGLPELERYLNLQLADRSRTEQLAYQVARKQAGLEIIYIQKENIGGVKIKRNLEDIVRLYLTGDTSLADGVLALVQTGPANGLYWPTGPATDRQLISEQLRTSLLAYLAFREIGRKDITERIISHLLASPHPERDIGKPYLGRNTLESARLVHTLLPDLLDDRKMLSPAGLEVVNGTEKRTYGDFPVHLKMSAAEYRRSRFAATGSGPLLLSAHQSWFATEPSAENGRGFTVQSRLIDEAGRPLSLLKEQRPCYFEVSVTTRSAAEYVLIEVPIPAGAEYADRQEHKGPFAVHRAYRRDRVAIFAERLPAGTHRYRVALRPRFSGEYTVNPARVELQYAPAVSGWNGLKTVRVE